VISPIIFSTSIVVLAFIPLFTLQGVEGKTFRPLAYTVALGMGGSLLFAALLVAPLSYWLMRRPRQRPNKYPDCCPARRQASCRRRP
jgi:cobalt-zinc-cadmium resistance protein CzcA